MQLPYVPDRSSVCDAVDLIARYGEGAGFEAALRADRSREVGNHIHFARWRQIERLIVVMSVERPLGTVH